MTWPLRMTRLRTLRWPRRGDEPQSLPRQVESIAEALDDDDGAADSTTATPKKGVAKQKRALLPPGPSHQTGQMRWILKGLQQRVFGNPWWLLKHLTTIKHCGRLVKGVVLGSEHGYIPGVIKVEKVGTCEVNGWKALDVDDNVRKGGQQAVYDAHCPKHCAVSMASTFLANIVKICRLGAHVA